MQKIKVPAVAMPVIPSNKVVIRRSGFFGAQSNRTKKIGNVNTDKNINDTVTKEIFPKRTASGGAYNFKVDKVPETDSASKVSEIPALAAKNKTIQINADKSFSSNSTRPSDKFKIAVEVSANINIVMKAAGFRKLIKKSFLKIVDTVSKNRERDNFITNI